MNEILTGTAGVLVLLAALGAWLRWAVLPVLGSYRLGVQIGRQLEAGRPATRARQLRAENRVLRHALAYATTGDEAETLRHEAHRPGGMLWRPWPVAAALAFLMPWRAVRAARTADRTLVYVTAAMLAQHRQHRQHHGTGPHPVLTSV